VFRQLPQRIAAATVEQVSMAAGTLLKESNRTVGRFEPLPIGAGDAAARREQA
jgi:hypothetical protein